jgi:hypothetical protein
MGTVEAAHPYFRIDPKATGTRLVAFLFSPGCPIRDDRNCPDLPGGLLAWRWGDLDPSTL